MRRTITLTLAAAFLAAPTAAMAAPAPTIVAPDPPVYDQPVPGSWQIDFATTSLTEAEAQAVLDNARGEAEKAGLAVTDQLGPHGDHTAASLVVSGPYRTVVQTFRYDPNVVGVSQYVIHLRY